MEYKNIKSLCCTPESNANTALTQLYDNNNRAYFSSGETWSFCGFSHFG